MLKLAQSLQYELLPNYAPGDICFLSTKLQTVAYLTQRLFVTYDDFFRAYLIGIQRIYYKLMELQSPITTKNMLG